MKLLLLLISIVQISLCLFYDLKVIDIVLMLVALILSVRINLFKIKIHSNLMLFFVLIYVFLSTSVVALFKYIPNLFSLSSQNVRDNDFIELASYSIRLVFTCFVVITTFYPYSIKRLSKTRKKYVISISASGFRVYSFIFFITFLSVVSLSIGIGKMGVENTKLPFRLSGIIQFLRVDIAPVFALLLYIKLKRRRNINDYRMRIFILCFFIWAIFESYVRLSKSALITSFLPIIFYEILIMKKINDLKNKVVYFVPLLIVFFLSYSIIENLRKSDSKGFSKAEIFNNPHKLNGTFLNPNANDLFVRPFNRFFMTGFHFITSYQSKNKENIFDFNNAFTILSMGGSARYKTFVIDRYPNGVAHSSGSTGIIDAFLVGGYGLSYLVLAGFLIIAIIIDSTLKSKIPLEISIMHYLCFFKFFQTLSISIFVDAMSIRYLIVYLLLLYYINVNKKLFRNENSIYLHSAKK